ncbi:YggT family protein [Oculatella sp. FACHB-28]|jgi:YggT family protein|uniref:YggT family protein n=1 Tax=Cyanophyceae TaxID=3028117 RepID=UPI00168645C0|nr:MULTISPECIES: YggT family protein [Cyanophyceae]MBD1866962.1 YggT family protein [Cyanobacteria bacterium FACHB-471]MBD2058993.1 YggT family protein [Oculatella sp. FACHB-28]MBD2070929.1 YggT family protein [Leptolyngbya sp. FACHB-671]
MTDPITLIAEPISIFLRIYIALLFIRILLSWFPTINWMNPPFSILSQLTDPYLNVFRSFIPPLGGIDLSPMLAIFLLGFVAQAVTGLAGGGQLAMY